VLLISTAVVAYVRLCVSMSRWVVECAIERYLPPSRLPVCLPAVVDLMVSHEPGVPPALLGLVASECHGLCC
jgi:hypothetical protein